MRAKALIHASDGAGLANEDRAGVAGRFAWIIDGASGFGTRLLTPGPTDAAWLAQTIDDELRDVIAQRPACILPDLLSTVEERLMRRYSAEGEPGDAAAAPSACLAVLEFAPGLHDEVVLRCRVVGDVAILVPSQHGIDRWTDERLKPFEARTLAALATADRRSEAIPPIVVEQIRRNRTSLNRPGGYAAVHPQQAWADAALSFETALPADMGVALATDGFLRLVDLFERMSDADLRSAVLDGRTEDLLADLRSLERGDPFGTRHRRVKTHDDATVLAVTAAPV